MIIESEDQADEACFNKLEADLAGYYADIDTEEAAYNRQLTAERSEEQNLIDRIYSTKGRQTVLTARLRYSHDKRAYRMDVSDSVSFKQFQEWFMYSKEWTDNEKFVRLTGEYISYKDESYLYESTLLLWDNELLHVTFDDYFNGWLKHSINSAKDDLNRLARELKQSLDDCLITV